MIYLIGELKLFLLAAFVIGALVGWGSCSRGDEEDDAHERQARARSRPPDFES